MAASAEPAVPPPLDRFLSYRLHLLKKLTDRHSSDAYAATLGLSVGEARCLAAIGNFAPLSLTDMAARANLTKSQASRGVQMLEDKGLAIKTASESDGRGLVLSLSATGKIAWRRAMKLIGRRNEEMFGCLSLPEQKQLGDILDRLINNARRL